MMRHRGRAFALALVFMLVGCAQAPGTTGAAPSPTVGSIPTGTATIRPGVYRIPRSAWSVADLKITFPKGWTVQYGHVYLKNSDQPSELAFYPVVVDKIFKDACKGGRAPMKVGPSVDDLAEALLRQPGPVVSSPVDTTLGGYPASRVGITVPEGIDLTACRLGDIGLQIWYSPPADKHFVLLPDAIARVYIVDVEGQRQVFLIHYRSATTEEDLRELQTILDSIQIET